MLLLQRMQVRAPLQATSRYLAPADRVASTSANASAFASTSTAARLHTTARRRDHYQTLEVPKGATQQDIKAQFYKLSKKWHPDVNPDSENAVKKFQEVSEAYHTLGSEASRKDYDRSLSGSRHGAARGADRGSFRYASENVARRASASYAWEYQKRHSQPRASSTGKSSSASQGRSQYHEFGRGGVPPSSSGTASMFEQFAQRERKKDAAAAARSANAGKNSPSTADRQEAEAQSASPLIRFAQIVGLFYIVFYFGTAFVDTAEPKRTIRRSS